MKWGVGTLYHALPTCFFFQRAAQHPSDVNGQKYQDSAFGEGIAPLKFEGFFEKECFRLLKVAAYLVIEKMQLLIGYLSPTCVLHPFQSEHYHDQHSIFCSNLMCPFQANL